MYTNDVIQHQLNVLRQRPHIEVVEPEYGRLASALEGEGVGRLAEPETILSRVVARLP
jgi:phosphopantothenoylcysteine synthetase/decarboxylase